jgi:hypothetical protein
MVRRSFSNPFLRVFSRRRSNDEDVSNRRKESLDQTVLSGDSSRFNPVASADGVPSHVQSSKNDVGVSVAGAGSLTSPALRASKSDPTMRSPVPPAEACQCYECMVPQNQFLPQRTDFANNFVGSPSYHQQQQQQQQFRPSTMNSQEVCQPPSNSLSRDPILQARIEAVEIQQRLLGEIHPDVIFSLTSLAKMCERKGDLELALEIMRESQFRTMKAKTLAYEQQISRLQHQQELENEFNRGGGVLVPSEISFSHENSYGR